TAQSFSTWLSTVSRDNSTEAMKGSPTRIELRGRHRVPEFRLTVKDRCPTTQGENMNAEKDKLVPAKPATPTTPGHDKDPRWIAGDHLGKDNEEKLDKDHLDDKSKKIGG